MTRFLVDPEDTMRDLEEPDAVDDTMVMLVETGQVMATCDECSMSVTPEEFEALECPRCGERDMADFLFFVPN